MLLSTIIALSSVLSPPNDPAAEIVRSPDGVLVTIVDAGKAKAPARVVLTHQGDDPEQVHGTTVVLVRPLMHDGVDVWRLGGPIPFGSCENAFIRGFHRRLHDLADGFGGSHRIGSTRVGATGFFNEFFEWERQGVDRDRADQMQRFRNAVSSECLPLVDYIKQRPEELYTNWDITFDYVYTTLDDVTVLMLRQGQMHRWTLQGTGWEGEGPYNPDWQTHAPFDTNIEGVFRVFMAGPELANHYIIDETGAIFIGCDRDHRQIG
ncbi:MAG: hypothetical protein ACR2GY_10590, partial [Phycisphaerales bacterium]